MALVAMQQMLEFVFVILIKTTNSLALEHAVLSTLPQDQMSISLDSLFFSWKLELNNAAFVKLFLNTGLYRIFFQGEGWGGGQYDLQNVVLFPL